MKNNLTTLEEIDKLKRKNLWTLFFINLIHGMGVGMFNVVYQPYVLDLTNSILITGVLITMGAFIQFIPMPLVGRLSDRIGRRKLMLISVPFYVIGLAFLIFSNSNTFLLLILGIISYYAGFIMNNLGTLIFISENSNKSKGLMYGLILFSFFGGTIGGSTFVLLGGAFDTRVFFGLFIGIMIVEGFINIVFLSDKLIFKKYSSMKILETDTEEGIWKKIMKNPRSKNIIIFFALDLFIYNIGLSIYSAGLRDFYLITREQLALITIVFNVTNVIFQIPGGHVADKIGKKKSLILSQFFGLSFFIINILAYYVWAGSFTAFLFPALLISQVPFALSVCTFIPSQQMSLTDLNETRKGESYGISGLLRGIGFLPTGYIGGFLIENVHYIAPLFVSFFGIFIEIWYLAKYFHE
ncbi:MAG: MFS transporter [Candidatus Thorarchaeota archaeon]